MVWIVVTAMSAMAAYGLLNILVPATTIGWQNRATAKRGGGKDSVGAAFQRAMGQATADGRHEPLVRKRVRLMGLCQIVIAALVILLAAITR